MSAYQRNAVRWILSCWGNFWEGPRMAICITAFGHSFGRDGSKHHVPQQRHTSLIVNSISWALLNLSCSQYLALFVCFSVNFVFSMLLTVFCSTLQDGYVSTIVVCHWPFHLPSQQLTLVTSCLYSGKWLGGYRVLVTAHCVKLLGAFSLVKSSRRSHRNLQLAAPNCRGL